MTKLIPEVPAGNAGVIAGVAQSFSFHSSPEEFLASRMLENQKKNPSGTNQRAVVRAKLLNRDVAIVSSYAQAKQVLQHRDTLAADNTNNTQYAARPAYSKLMEPFFPSPNLLLTDGYAHAEMREQWGPVLKNLASAHSEYAAVARQWFSELPLATDIQLYQTMKYLSWRLILVPTLGVSPGGDVAREIENLQEDLLRGQFSILPVSINTGIWQSARSKGIAARERLQEIYRERLRDHRPQWLSASLVESRREEVVNHLILITSSLAVKGLASLLTALFLNYYLYGKTTGQPLNRDNTESLVKETMRLSPPIVGVMRHVTEDSTLSSSGDDKDILIPKGWDVWTYLAGANRDPEAFGDDCDIFRQDRYSTGSDVPEPLTLGAGPKQCPGQDMITSCCFAVLEAVKTLEVSMVGQAPAPGVKAWLGWEKGAPEVWSRDMKQMPTQHPSEPVMVQFTRGYIESRKSYEK